MKPLLEGISSTLESKFSLDKLLCMFSIPVGHHVVKKNNRPIHVQGGRPVIGKSPELRVAEEYLTLHLKSQSNSQGITRPYREDLWLIAHFYFKLEHYITHKGERKKSMGDLDNLLCLPIDCMQSAGIIFNDSQICSLDLSRRLVGPETRLELFLLKFDDSMVPQLELENK